MRSIQRWAMIPGGILMCLALAAASQDATKGGSYVNVRYFLDVGGGTLAIFKSIQGGNSILTPVVKGLRPDKYVDKASGPVKLEEFVITMPITTHPTLLDWINVYSSPAVPPTKTLTVVETDLAGVEKSRRTLDACGIVSAELPACEAGSSATGNLKLTVLPAAAKDTLPAKGAVLNVGSIPNQKLWTAAAFKLSIDGLATSKVSRVSGLSVKHAGTSPPEYSNLVITVPDTELATFKAWATQWEAGKQSEKNGKLEFLDPNLTSSLLTASFEGLGVVRIYKDAIVTNDQAVPSTMVELFVEKVTFSWPSP